MRDFVIQALLTRIRSIKECVIYIFTLMISVFNIWRINHNATVIGSNIHCDLIKQPGETVSVGINEHLVCREGNHTYNKRMCDL